MKKIFTTFLIFAWCFTVLGQTQSIKYHSFYANNGWQGVSTTLNNFSTCQTAVSLAANGGLYDGVWSDGNYNVIVNGNTIGNYTGAQTLDLTSYIPVTSVQLVNTETYYWATVDATVTITSQSASMPTAGPTVSNLTYCVGETASQLTATLSGTGATLKWYTSVNGDGYSATAPTPSAATAGTTSYWVAQADAGGCESVRSQINVVVSNCSSLSYHSANANNGFNGVSTTLNNFSTCQTEVSLAAYGGLYTGVWNNGNYNVIVNGTTIGNYTGSQTLDLTSYIPVTSVQLVNTETFNWATVDATVTVTSQSASMPTAGPTVSNLDYCVGETASQLTATLSGTGATLKWYTSVNGDGYSATAPTPSAATAGTTSYWVAQADAGGCESVRSQINVVVHALPTVTASSDATNNAVCEGSDITLMGGGADTYIWNNSVTDNVAFTPADTTTYTVTGTDVNGCENTATITVYTLALPVVSNLTGDVEACGDASSHDFEVTNNVNYSYEWNYSDDLLNWVVIDGSYGESNFNTNVMTMDSLESFGWDEYYVAAEVTGANGCSVISDASFITVNELPTVTASSDALNNTVCEGSDITLTGDGADSYVWDNGVSDNTAFALADTMTYTVTGTDVNGCENTESITVYTLALPAVTASSDALNNTVCEGSDITLMGDGADSYVWDNGVSNNTAFALTDTMTYEVTGTDVNGCENTASITVYTLALPAVTASSDALNNTVCEGNDITLTGGGANSYVWDNGVIDNTAFALADTMTYTVTGTDLNGCVNTATITVYTDLCTGLADNTIANLSVYPNPTTGNVTITTSGTVANSIEVFDVVGNFVANVLVTSETTNINLSTYADGVYVVKVRSNNTAQNIRIVKAK